MVQQQKDILRKKVLAYAGTLPHIYRQKSDKKIMKKLISLTAVKTANIIFCYVSVGGEIDTHSFIEKMWSEGKTVCVPFCLENGVMVARKITSFEQLKPTKHGLYEPDSTAPIIAPEAIDFIVVPCVSCGKNGVRLGYGGGFYDRYLPHTACPIACLCRCKLLQENIPEEPHDRRMPCVITEKQVYFP